ncbi:unnamed protein product [Brugia pahangi]|uniref:Ovule protein n=1 Tax=Brugia pahangi TaxID=6280 RepID=A0A0N4T7P9_BRUPA|nr:unnamed protein product [Brugia pahangi]
MYKNVLGQKLLQCRKAIVLRCLMRDLCQTTIEMMHRLIHFTSYLTPIALRHNTLSSCKETGTSSTYDIGNSDNSSERLCTVPTKYYHNNVTTSITIPYNITHSKQSSAVVLQNAQKETNKVAVGVVTFKQKKHLIRGSHPFVMTQPTDCSQSVCLSQTALFSMCQSF